MACVRDALAVVLGEAPGKAAVLGAIARGVLGGHARELPDMKAPLEKVQVCWCDPSSSALVTSSLGRCIA